MNNKLSLNSDDIKTQINLYSKEIDNMDSNAKIKYHLESERLKSQAKDLYETRLTLIPKIKGSLLNQSNLSDKQLSAIDSLTEKLLSAIEDDDLALIGKYTLAIEKMSKSVRSITENTKDVFQILGLSSGEGGVKIDFNNATFENYETNIENDKEEISTDSTIDIEAHTVRGVSKDDYTEISFEI
jgi:hypothetical protein